MLTRWSVLAAFSGFGATWSEISLSHNCWGLLQARYLKKCLLMGRDGGVLPSIYLNLTCANTVASGGTKHGVAGLPFHPAASVPAGTHTMSALIKSRRVTRCPRGAATVVGPIMPTPMSAPRSLDTTGPTLCRRPRYSHLLPLSHMHQLHLQQPLHGILYQHRVTFHHSPAPRLCHLCLTQLPALLHRPLTPHHNLYLPVPILQLPPPINL